MQKAGEVLCLAGSKERTTSKGSSEVLCAKHGIPYEVNEAAGFKIRFCSQCGEESEAEAKRQEEIQQVAAVNAMLLSAGIPLRFQEKSLTDYQISNSKQRAVVEYIREWVQRDCPGGLILMGRPGTGKNHLATGIVRHMITQKRKAAVMTTAFKILRAIKATWNEGQGKEGDVILSFVQPYLLVIDEVGVQFNSDTERLYLSEIINARYEWLRPTILLTNLTMTELTPTIGERVIDRFREGGKVLVFDWESFRGKEGQEPAKIHKTGIGKGSSGGVG